MGRGEFEEILEECLSALLEGQRSVEESLSLYPAWRGRLEPLLRAAEEVAAAFDQSSPPYVKERGLQHFLEAVRSRRRLRQILSPRPAGLPWWRWASAGLAAAVVIGALALLSGTLMAEDGRRLGDQVSVRPYVPTPERTAAPASVESPLERVQEQVAVLEEAVRRGETVEVGLLEELEEASSDLAESLGDPREVALLDRMAAVSAASKEYKLLQTLREQSSGAERWGLEATLAAAENVLEKLGATPEPEPTPPPEPTASPSVTPSPSPTPTPSVEGTPARSPTPAPGD